MIRLLLAYLWNRIFSHQNSEEKGCALLMDIIFVRHGKAEELSAVSEDSKRQLTKEGKKSIKATVDQIVNYIKSENEIYIWSSSAARAIQTAKILADKLNVHNLKMYHFILTGDYDAFVNEMKELKEKTTLIVVGHEPHLSDWSKQIQDKNIPFEKGTMAGFEIQNMEPIQGLLRWIVYPDLYLANEKTTRKKKKISKDEYCEILKENVGEIEKYKRQFLLITDDKETVHRLRIKIRRIRSLLSFIKPLIEASEYAAIQEKLKNMEQKFSKIREIDVLLAGWDLLKCHNTEVLRNHDVLLELLETKRKQEVEMLLEYEKSRDFDKELLEISDVIKQLHIDIQEGVPFYAFSSKRIKKWHNKLENNIKILNNNDIEAIHNTRIEFKKVRYVEDSLNSFGIQKKRNLSELERSQDVLGDLCDTYRNIATLKELIESSESELFHYYTGVFIGYELARRERLIKEATKVIKKH